MALVDRAVAQEEVHRRVQAVGPVVGRATVDLVLVVVQVVEQGEVITEQARAAVPRMVPGA
ncbi:MAG TPA: hypothetical protein VJQ55_11660, partial [Candidatus Binatia bacterium]|nr:hypothetical protein [Candidatus Binatia bacterium]